MTQSLRASVPRRSPFPESRVPASFAVAFWPFPQSPDPGAQPLFVLAYPNAPEVCCTHPASDVAAGRRERRGRPRKPGRGRENVYCSPRILTDRGIAMKAKAWRRLVSAGCIASGGLAGAGAAALIGHVASLGAVATDWVRFCGVVLGCMLGGAAGLWVANQYCRSSNFRGHP